MEDFQELRKDLSDISNIIQGLIGQIQGKKGIKIEPSGGWGDDTALKGEESLEGYSQDSDSEMFRAETEFDDKGDEKIIPLRDKTFNPELRSLISDITGEKGAKKAKGNILIRESGEDDELVGDLDHENLEEHDDLTVPEEYIRPAVPIESEDISDDFEVENELGEVKLSSKLKRFRYDNTQWRSVKSFLLDKYLSHNELLSFDHLQNITVNPKEKDLLVFLGSLKNEIEKVKDFKSDNKLITDILLPFWEENQSALGLKYRFSEICFQIGSALKSRATVAFVYSVKETCFLPFFHKGLDTGTQSNLAFIPGEEVIRELLNLQSPMELYQFSLKDDPFFRKKFSKRFWNHQDKLLFFPILGNYKDMKPKNLVFLMYVIPSDVQLPNTDYTRLKNRVHALLGNFFPLVDLFQEIFETDEEKGFQVVDEIYSILKDRRSYNVERVSREAKQFIIINFQLSTANPNEHNVSFQYLVTKISKHLSYNSKILRYSFDKGYVVLRGEDSGISNNIVQIFKQHSDRVLWSEKSFPDHGKNLYSYQ